MAGSTGDYHHGGQDVSEQQATFHLVMGMTKWGCLALGAMLGLLVMWFCTPNGFLSGLILAVVILVAGIALLRDRGGH